MVGVSNFFLRFIEIQSPQNEEKIGRTKGIKAVFVSGEMEFRKIFYTI